MGHEQNLKLTKRFDELFSGGHSNFRIAIEASEHRVFLTRAEGSHLWMWMAMNTSTTWVRWARPFWGTVTPNIRMR